MNTLCKYFFLKKKVQAIECQFLEHLHSGETSFFKLHLHNLHRNHCSHISLIRRLSLHPSRSFIQLQVAASGIITFRVFITHNVSVMISRLIYILGFLHDTRQLRLGTRHQWSRERSDWEGYTGYETIPSSKRT